MRSTILLPALIAVASASSPFSSPLQIRNGAELFERATNDCPANSATCSGIGYPGFCCFTGSTCALDNSGHIACCPNGEFCEGSVPTAATTVIPVAGAISTVYNGASQVISVITTQYSDFRSDLGGWYTSLTSQYGSGYTALLNAQGQYVTTVVEVVGNVATTTTITIALPTDAVVVTTTTGTGTSFVQAAGATATVTIIKNDASSLKVGALGGVLGVFVAVIGWML